MKIGVIPDLHEKTIWSDFIRKYAEVDKWIFLGDYVDSWGHDHIKCVENLYHIIEYKRKNWHKVELLMGNHELSYLNAEYRCSGFCSTCAIKLSLILSQHAYMFDVAFSYKNALFTHAGVTTKWFRYYEDVIEDSRFDYTGNNLGSVLNKIFKSNKAESLFRVGIRGGRRGVAGPLWADKTETLEGIIPGYHQIVGHTPVNEITKVEKIMGITYDDRSITYVDCLDKKDDILILTL